MRLIHLTDPHLSSLEGQTFGSVRGKRRSGYLSWSRNRRLVHKRHILDVLTKSIQAESAGQIVLSGDMVQIGLDDEIRQVSNWLDELAPSEQIFFVPGNHDVYAADSWASMRRHWSSVLPTPVNDIEDTSTSAYPLIRNIGGIQLIGVSSACVTPIFSARGAVGKRQMNQLWKQLQECQLKSRLSCLVIHHPPLPEMAKWRKALKEVHALKSLLQEHQPALVLCGHLHHNTETLLGKSRVYCTSSASSTRNASYRVFDVEETDRGWNFRMQLKTITTNGKQCTVQADQSWTCLR
jgi:3',5'-cyclic AMP phosphodiesterase CpdA